MKTKIILFILLISQQSFSMSVEHFWNEDFDKKVTLTCTEDEDACRNFCGRDLDCSYTETVCRNCLGSSLQMSYIFTEMGRLYRNTGVKMSYDRLYDLLRSKRYVSLSSKSIYNQVTSFNALSVKRRFRSLCDGAREPIAFFHTEGNGKVGEPAFVACDNEVFELIHDPSGVVHGTDQF